MRGGKAEQVRKFKSHVLPVVITHGVYPICLNIHGHLIVTWSSRLEILDKDHLFADILFSVRCFRSGFNIG